MLILNCLIRSSFPWENLQKIVQPTVTKLKASNCWWLQLQDAIAQCYTNLFLWLIRFKAANSVKALMQCFPILTKGLDLKLIQTTDHMLLLAGWRLCCWRLTRCLSVLKPPELSSISNRHPLSLFAAERGRVPKPINISASSTPQYHHQSSVANKEETRFLQNEHLRQERFFF